MFGCLKHVVREIPTDRFEIVFRGSKVAMARDLEQEFELRLMEPKAVDLLMAHGIAADDRLRIEQSSSRGAQTGVCRERLVCAYPQKRIVPSGMSTCKRLRIARCVSLRELPRL